METFNSTLNQCNCNAYANALPISLTFEAGPQGERRGEVAGKQRRLLSHFFKDSIEVESVAARGC